MAEPCRIWCVQIDEAGWSEQQAPEAWAAAWACLPDEERAQALALGHATKRLHFVWGRALLRSALSWVGEGRAPASWPLMVSAHGKPMWADPDEAWHGVFNLSNTAGWLVCAVAPGAGLLGVDVEAPRAVQRPAELASRHFLPHEAHWLQRHPLADQTDAFLRLWTLKEAVAKAVGEGLGLGLQRFGFPSLGANGSGEPVVPSTEVALWLDEGLGEAHAGPWRCQQWHLPDGAWLALARAGACAEPLAPPVQVWLTSSWRAVSPERDGWTLCAPGQTVDKMGE